MNTALLLLGDFIVFYFALFVALSLRVVGIVSLAFYAQHVMPFLLLFVIVICILYFAGFYDEGSHKSAKVVFSTLLTAIFFFAVVSVALFYFLPLFGLTPKITLVLFIAVLFIVLFFWHVYAPRVLSLAYPKALLVGGPPLPWGFDVVRIVPSASDPKLILGTIAGAEVERVLIDFTDSNIKKLLPELHTLMLSGSIFIDTSTLREEFEGKVDLQHVDESWLLAAAQKRGTRMFLLGKRILDVALTALMLPFYIAVLPLVALVIKLEDGKHVFIKQKRYGLNRRPFILYKFRTMVCDDDGYWHKGDKDVVTKVGAFLRKSRVDELPQLWNVLKGDMALIGPRPDMVKFGQALASKIEYYDARYIVRPGLTGWAQVSQSVIPQSIKESQERLAYDLYYIKHLSLFLELKIVLRTAKLLLVKVFTKDS